MQLLDELSMIYTTCIMFYALFSHRQSRQRSLLIFLCISGVAIFITAYYHYLQDPAFHQNAFALLTTILVLRSMYIMEKLLRPSRQSGYSPQRGEPSTYEEKEEARKAARDTEILNTMWQMIGCGLGAVACGFLVWTLDNIYCGVLRGWRREIGLPWGILLEGHGWWHIMTGIAAYYNLTWAVWLSYCRDGKQDEVRLVWPSLFTAVPDVVKKNNVKSSHDIDSSISKKGI
ncbi:ceramidase [Bisporella sp. PMI_857]|nr:ceramidase [Bisporella sp. PMI_857]